MKKIILFIILLSSLRAFGQSPLSLYDINTMLDSLPKVSGTTYTGNVGAPSFIENGTALTSKYARLVQLDTMPKLSNASNTFTGNIKASHLALGTSGASPIAWNGVGVATGDSLMIGFNLVNTTLNTVRNSVAQSTDTSSASIRLTRWTGKPMMDFVDNTGNITFKIDSLGRVTSGSISSSSSVTASNFVATLTNSGYQAANSGYFFWSGRSSMRSSADGKFEFTNNAETAFTDFKLGAGNITARIVRGTTDTDITAIALRDANGVEWYWYPDTSGNLIKSASIP